jgi:hypothetical protein
VLLCHASSNWNINTGLCLHGPFAHWRCNFYCYLLPRWLRTASQQTMFVLYWLFSTQMFSFLCYTHCTDVRPSVSPQYSQCSEFTFKTLQVYIPILNIQHLIPLFLFPLCLYKLHDKDHISTLCGLSENQVSPCVPSCSFSFSLSSHFFPNLLFQSWAHFSSQPFYFYFHVENLFWNSLIFKTCPYYLILLFASLPSEAFILNLSHFNFLLSPFQFFICTP